jgi:hypothetical protein
MGENPESIQDGVTAEHPQARVAEQVKVCVILGLVVGHNDEAN